MPESGGQWTRVEELRGVDVARVGAVQVPVQLTAERANAGTEWMLVLAIGAVGNLIFGAVGDVVASSLGADVGFWQAVGAVAVLRWITRAGARG